MIIVLRPLRSPRFRLLFAGRLVSFVGNAFAPIALAFAVLDLTGSASDLGLVLAARSVPTIALLLFGGVWADRLPRHVLLVGFSLIAAVAQAGAAALLLGGVARVWQLAALEAVNGAGAAFLFPASQGAVPQTISAEDSQQANALLRLARNVAGIVGAGLAGVVVATVGPGWGIAVDALSFVVAAGLFAGLRLPGAGGVSAGVLRELVEGWREFRSRTWLWAIVVQFGFVNAAFSAGFEVLGPVVAVRELGGAAAWGLVVAVVAAGYLVGGGVGLWWRPGRPLLVATFGVLTGVPLLGALALGGSLPLIIGAAVLFGAGIETFGVQWDTAVQHHVPPAALSRVYAYDALGSDVVKPAGQTLAGPATAVFGLAGAIGGSAVVIGVATLAVLLVREVRTMPRHRTA